jgi:hypothetical protein
MLHVVVSNASSSFVQSHNWQCSRLGAAMPIFLSNRVNVSCNGVQCSSSRAHFFKHHCPMFHAAVSNASSTSVRGFKRYCPEILVLASCVTQQICVTLCPYDPNLLPSLQFAISKYNTKVTCEGSYVQNDLEEHISNLYFEINIIEIISLPLTQTYTYLSIYPSIHPSIHPSTYLFIVTT